MTNPLLKISDPFNRNIIVNIFKSYIYQFIGTICSLLIIPLSLRILNETEYGIWLTIFSVVNYINILDIGLSHGLRNRLTPYISNKDYKSAKTLVSTAYLMLFVIIGVVIIIGLPITIFIPWEKILNINDLNIISTNILILLSLTTVCLRIVLKLIESIGYAYQWSSLSNFLQIIGQLITLSLLYIIHSFTNYSSSRLLTYAIIVSLVPVVILIISSLFLFRGRFKDVKPEYKYFDKAKIKDILSLGFDFFIIQISITILYTTDNFIISNIFSPKDVTPYYILLKYFGFPLIFFRTIMNSYWSAITVKKEENNYVWIHSVLSKLHLVLLIFIAILILLYLIYPAAIKLWLGKTISFDPLLLIGVIIFTLLSLFNSVYSYILNGLTKIKLQKFLAIISILINVPLSYLLAKTLNLGVSGVIFATNISLLIYVIVKRIEVRSTINKQIRLS